jgi:phosphohistidine phosphatase
MKTLHLLRHAKSSWKDAALDDHERPLSKRGRETAKMLGRYLRREKIKPDVVVCSSAVRATETLAPIRKKTKPRKIVLEDGIYEAPQQKLWERILTLPEKAESVLLIGHNPALQELALELADAESRARFPAIEAKFPTGAIATFRLKGAWKELRPNGAALAEFTTPKGIARKGG